jgi:hypothetical protein
LYIARAVRDNIRTNTGDFLVMELISKESLKPVAYRVNLEDLI